ncbi:dsDNA nuclease domain-containing protein [Streptacidiphilus sp. MAP5-3]|uniref:dsDNA nuclease domain-containing protein n=1 Tax=unclassified Streptacidiphilus TaxID=2643834 RepID=UPI0035195433
MDLAYVPAPDDTGAKTGERFEFQTQAALHAVLGMLCGNDVAHVTCEHFEDFLTARRVRGGQDGDLLWEFWQVKSRESGMPWGLGDLLGSKALKALWRTHQAVRGRGHSYLLVVGVEGQLKETEDVRLLASGQADQHQSVLDRVTGRLKASSDEIAAFLRLVRVRALPSRGELRLRNESIFSERGSHLQVQEVRSLFNRLEERIREAMRGHAGSSSPVDATEPAPGDGVLRRRLSADNLSDIWLALSNPYLQDFLHASQRAITQHPYSGLTGTSTPPLDSIYTPLRLRRTPEPASADAIGTRDRVGLGNDPVGLVLAEAGGGKSSLLRAIQAEQAGCLLRGQPVAFLAVLVPAAAILDGALPRAVASAASAELAGHGLMRDLPAEFFRARPVPEVDWLVLVDGLDEITDEESRKRLLAQLALLAAEPDCVHRFVVASRILPDQELELAGKGVPRYEILPFDGDGLVATAQAWFAWAGLPDADDKAEQFLVAVESAGLSGFASRPLLAAMLCQLYTKAPDERLPATRTELYRRFTEALIARMQDSGLVGIRQQAESTLRRFGLDAMTRGDAFLDRLPQWIDQFAADWRVRTDRDWASDLTAIAMGERPMAVPEEHWNRFVVAVLRRSGLLTGPAGRLEFAHRTLQEYCAARHLAQYPERHAAELGRQLELWGNPYQDDNPWSSPLHTASYIGFLLDAGVRSSIDGPETLRGLAVPENIRGCLLIAELLTLRVLVGDSWAHVVRAAADAAAEASEKPDEADEEWVDEPRSRVLAAEVLVVLDRERGLDRLESLARDEDTDCDFNEDPSHPGLSPRLLAASRVLDEDTARGIDLYVELAADDSLHGSVRIRMAEQVAEADDPRAEAVLEALASADLYFDDRLLAATYLAALAPDSAADHLYALITEHWQDPDWHDWCPEAIEALAELGDPRSQEFRLESS